MVSSKIRHKRLKLSVWQKYYDITNKKTRDDFDKFFIKEFRKVIKKSIESKD
jgi:hypothetical protein